MARPAHLEPSKLGTREYWDELYTTELANHAHDPADTGTAWFDDSDAEAKLIEFLEESERAGEFGLDVRNTSFLDLGTGNGALLFALRDNGWEGAMLGVDYSALSVRFARRIERARRDVHFAEHDILHSPATALLDERYAPSIRRGWDVVLDKGTFDAISLSAETIRDDADADTRRVNEVYGTRILPLVREGGLFLITSCNWTEAELRSWFGAAREILPNDGEGNGYWGFEVVGRVEYRSFSFGGVKGQTISSLCFRKVRRGG
ncbi:hypothetical protein F5B22DRAFT_632416 [Xylaria bambusicola]|uniref:uncharacterized protein n=1 Tax=Xylaria bambusicola TaxID=326684 RepID=UPI002008B207|nr:uncharacterized protein F5B22DRAFT_632416 [Xylaria bambusicola]KAI0527831.1 hypothetical protein F5B22DRAFT_632416 [Xylaria bambusicola]